jgi:hypothetical protein
MKLTESQYKLIMKEYYELTYEDLSKLIELLDGLILNKSELPTDIQELLPQVKPELVDGSKQQVQTIKRILKLSKNYPDNTTLVNFTNNFQGEGLLSH